MIAWLFLFNKLFQFICSTGKVLDNARRRTRLESKRFLLTIKNVHISSIDLSVINPINLTNFDLFDSDFTFSRFFFYIFGQIAPVRLLYSNYAYIYIHYFKQSPSVWVFTTIILSKLKEWLLQGAPSRDMI